MVVLLEFGMLIPRGLYLTMSSRGHCHSQQHYLASVMIMLQSFHGRFSSLNSAGSYKVLKRIVSVEPGSESCLIPNSMLSAEQEFDSAIALPAMFLELFRHSIEHGSSKALLTSCHSGSLWP